MKACSIARFFMTQYESGVRELSFQFDEGRASRDEHRGGKVALEYDRMTHQYLYDGMVQITTIGHLLIVFDAALRITRWAFRARYVRELIARETIVRLSRLQQAISSNGILDRAQLTVPPSPVNQYGVTAKTMRYLEMADTVCQLSDIMDLSSVHRIGPRRALWLAAKACARNAAAPLAPDAPPHRSDSQCWSDDEPNGYGANGAARTGQAVHGCGAWPAQQPVLATRVAAAPPGAMAPLAMPRGQRSCSAATWKANGWLENGLLPPFVGDAAKQRAAPWAAARQTGDDGGTTVSCDGSKHGATHAADAKPPPTPLPAELPPALIANTGSADLPGDATNDLLQLESLDLPYCTTDHMMLPGTADACELDDDGLSRASDLFGTFLAGGQ